MPVNKDSLRRYRIEDRLLSDPYCDYTTEKIREKVNREMAEEDRVEIRMIQKDIKALEEVFGKEMVRGEGGRGTVRYKDQSSPLFYQELTSDEETILREALGTLGQFQGLDNLTWLELLKKKLDVSAGQSTRPAICFSHSSGLQMPPALLGRLYTAISRRKVIRFYYRKFKDDETRTYTVHPYQLRQYNDRWYLVCNPLADERYAFNPDYIATFPLDRMSGRIDDVDDEPFIDTTVDLEARYEETVGVTLYTDMPVEDIYFAADADTMPYVETKWLHPTQIRLDAESEEEFRRKYPTLKDCAFYSIECRPNKELYNLFSSYAGRVTLVEPEHMREELARRMDAASSSYRSLRPEKAEDNDRKQHDNS